MDPRSPHDQVLECPESNEGLVEEVGELPLGRAPKLEPDVVHRYGIAGQADGSCKHAHQGARVVVERESVIKVKSRRERDEAHPQCLAFASGYLANIDVAGRAVAQWHSVCRGASVAFWG